MAVDAFLTVGVLVAGAALLLVYTLDGGVELQVG